jgi:glycosyltransferase involved in cell wall biosynthesis
MYPRLFRWRFIEKLIDRYVLPRADLVAAGNKDILDYALANGATEEHSTMFLVGCLIEPLHFVLEPRKRPSVRAELGLSDQPVLVCVSRLEAVKCPEDVVRVTALAKRRVPDLVGVVVGDGSMRPELEEMVLDLGLGDDFKFVGNRDQEWIASALACATVVLSPLSGRALVEAALSGTPIVAYDVDWQSELVRTGETGILVPYREIDQMATAVVDLCGDRDMASSLGAAGREFALEVMDPRKLVRHEREAYRQLLGRHALGSAGRAIG